MDFNQRLHPELNGQSESQLPHERKRPTGFLHSSEAIRPELSIEKWPAIWHPANSTKKPEVARFSRQVKQADGNIRNASVEVGYTQLGNLTTEDQKTYYALIRHWETKGRSAEQTPFSTRKLAKLLKKKWGSNVIDAITESLRRLRTTPFLWTNSYHDSATGHDIEVLDTFTLLSDLKIIRRKLDGHITKEAGYFRFHDSILRNLLARHTKPLLFDVVLGFKSQIAQLIYVHIDLILAKSDQYERRTKLLFDDLGLKGVAYRNSSNRKQRLEIAMRELQSVRLSTGVLVEARLEKTKDRQDYKVVFRKAKHASSDWTTSETDGKELRNREVSALDVPLHIQARELVRHFYKVFHAVEVAVPTGKEIGQATAMLATHGFVRARHIINFSKEAATHTGYDPQSFGGILQYASRALMDDEMYKHLQRIGRKPQPLQNTRADKARAEDDRISRELALLPVSEYAELHRTAEIEFMHRFPRLKGFKKTIFNAAIRSRMVQMLETEGRTLLVPGSSR